VSPTGASAVSGAATREADRERQSTTLPLLTQHFSDCWWQPPDFSRLIHTGMLRVPLGDESRVSLTRDAIAKARAGATDLFDRCGHPQGLIEMGWCPVATERLAYREVHSFSLKLPVGLA